MIHNLHLFCHCLCSSTLPQTSTIQRNESSVILGSLSCQGNETDIGLCKGDLDKSTCSDDVAQIDCTGRYLILVTKVASSHTMQGEVYSIQNCVTSLSETCDRSVLFSQYIGVLHK
jgi:hypothetical protein